jgi:hypothetical protein
MLVAIYTTQLYGRRWISAYSHRRSAPPAVRKRNGVGSHCGYRDDAPGTALDRSRSHTVPRARNVTSPNQASHVACSAARTTQCHPRMAPATAGTIGTAQRKKAGSQFLAQI